MFTVVLNVSKVQNSHFVVCFSSKTLLSHCGPHPLSASTLPVSAFSSSAAAFRSPFSVGSPSVTELVFKENKNKIYSISLTKFYYKNTFLL